MGKLECWSTGFSRLGLAYLRAVCARLLLPSPLRGRRVGVEGAAIGRSSFMGWRDVCVTHVECLQGLTDIGISLQTLAIASPPLSPAEAAEGRGEPEGTRAPRVRAGLVLAWRRVCASHVECSQ